MLKGFKDFLLRGNVVDLAVAVVIGAAFTAVVSAFTNAFLKPLIQLFSGGGEFAGKFVVKGVEFDYATFINSTITFVITAAVVYFLVVAPMKWLVERRRRGEEEGPAESTDVELLTEIRDLLQAQADATASAEERTARTGDHAGTEQTRTGPSATGEPSVRWADETDGHRRPAGRVRDEAHDRRPAARPGSHRSRHAGTSSGDATRR